MMAGVRRGFRRAAEELRTGYAAIRERPRRVDRKYESGRSAGGRIPGHRRSVISRPLCIVRRGTSQALPGG